MKKLLIIIVCIMFVVSLQAKTSKDVKTTNNKSNSKAKTKKTSKKTSKKSSHDKNRGWYVGGGIGTITSNPTIFIQDGTNLVNTEYVMKVNNSITFNGGYTFFPWFALEGELNKSFNAEDSNTKVVNGDVIHQYYDNQFDSVYLNTVFKYTFKKKHTPFIKLGLGYNNYKQQTSSSVQNQGVGSITYYNDKMSFDNLGTHFAIGYEYAINYNNSVAISYDFYNMFEDTSYNLNGMDITQDNGFAANYIIKHKEIKIQYKYSFK